MSVGGQYRLPAAFADLFQGRPYNHRKSTQGDMIVVHLYEDLFELSRSPKLKDRPESRRCGLREGNTLQGIRSRRGDGTFGELVPHLKVVEEPGFSVVRGKLATVEIGIEVKIVAKAMIKQIDRVAHDLVGQIAQFRKGNEAAISVGVAGVNHAEHYTSYEGVRDWPTDGKKYKHPIQEAASAEAYLDREAKPQFDEFLVLRFRASNVEPYPFEWVDERATFADYGAILTRVARKYETRF
jgi:hypothetical protein